MKDEVAGDPVSGLKWSRKSTYKIAGQLKRINISVCASTVARLLKAQRFSLRKNRKNIESTSNKTDRKQRDRQFRYIGRQRRAYEAQDLPVVSIDTKSRERIGCFYQDGRRWSQELIEVFDHDFPSQAYRSIFELTLPLARQPTPFSPYLRQTPPTRAAQRSASSPSTCHRHFQTLPGLIVTPRPPPYFANPQKVAFKIPIPPLKFLFLS